MQKRIFNPDLSIYPVLLIQQTTEAFSQYASIFYATDANTVTIEGENEAYISTIWNEFANYLL